MRWKIILNCFLILVTDQTYNIQLILPLAFQNNSTAVLFLFLSFTAYPFTLVKISVIRCAAAHYKMCDFAHVISSISEKYFDIFI